MGNRYLDWFRQAEADLRHAQNALDSGDFEWSCFAAQQSAENALKAVYQKQGMEAWGHTVTVLVGNLPYSRDEFERLGQESPQRYATITSGLELRLH